MSKKLCILGSTGSIGTQALEVADIQKDIEIMSLCANKNAELMQRQIRKYKPRRAAMMDYEAYKTLKTAAADTSTKILYGMDGFLECAGAMDTETVLVSIVGFTGLLPTIEAINAGKTIALANKETLVAGGSIVMPLAHRKNVNILPVDSEHSAIFQCSHNQHAKIAKILLTASGGPFFGKKNIADMTPKEALKHPNWSMGAKITVDSASMMNKGLEAIEASWLFDVPIDNIQVIIQRQSIIHSMVEYDDYSVIAQLSSPDMKLPISYALNYPERRYCATAPVDFWSLSSLTFDKPDFDTFPCLNLAYGAARTGGTAPAVLNSANEKAVELFLGGSITFGDIPILIKNALNAHTVINNPTLDDLIKADKETRAFVEGMI